ncbi:MAG: aspartate/glutamate racemase family protein [Emergencia sp.]
MSIKLKQVVPVTGDFLLDDETIRYNCKYLNKDTSVEILQIAEGQLSIESEYDEAINAAQVVRLCKKAAEEDCDGIFVDCFGDPGVRGAREITDVPVFGGFEPAIHIALGLGDRIGIVTVLENVIPLIEGGIAKSHLGERVVSVRSVDIPVADLEKKDVLAHHIVDEAIEMIKHERVSVIVLGCTGMIDVAETVECRLEQMGYEIPVVEAAQAALNMLEMYAKMGLKHSRITYMKPPQKDTI